VQLVVRGQSARIRPARAARPSWRAARGLWRRVATLVCLRAMAGPAAERTVRIRNSAGLHARPCHAFVTVAAAHKAALRVRSGGVEVDGKSILSLMTLGAPVEAELRLRAEGEDAQALVDALVALVESGFGELD
jgi:phosphotransferase system HPr (HPr) family protein